MLLAVNPRDLAPHRALCRACAQATTVCMASSRSARRVASRLRAFRGLDFAPSAIAPTPTSKPRNRRLDTSRNTRIHIARQFEFRDRVAVHFVRTIGEA